MTNNVKDTLAQRGSVYGDFSDNARIHQKLLAVMMAEPGWTKLSDAHKSCMDLFCQKQARILNGDPNYKDNWHDIGGYAKLGEDRCSVVVVETSSETSPNNPGKVLWHQLAFELGSCNFRGARSPEALNWLNTNRDRIEKALISLNTWELNNNIHGDK